uniref:High mobility group nucleosome-binding domain-containing protein 5 n=1 Tax=Caenorhabditis tropicalis TaxID=1561998 RepID=A0A1I7T6Z4_9PELO
MTTQKSKPSTAKNEKKGKTSKGTTKKKNATLTASRSQTTIDKEVEKKKATKKSKEEIGDEKKGVLPKKEEIKDAPGKKDSRAVDDNNKPNEPSGIEPVVDDKKTKMDDGYEDFGPGAGQ